MRISDWSSDVCSSDLADVEGALGKAFGELVEAGARRHRRGHRDDGVVVLGLGDEGGGEDILVARRLGRALGLLAGHHVELGDAVVLVGGGLGRLVALRSEEQTSELQSLMRISYSVFCLKQKTN